MAQHDYIIDNGSGAVVRSDINNLAQAIATNNSGTTAPSVTYPRQWWPDETTGRLKQRNAANTAWVDIGPLETANLGMLPATGGTATGAITMSGAPVNHAQGADIASASTVNLNTATGNYVFITGTTAITEITLSQGREREVKFAGVLTLTNGASLILPSGANITTAAGDVARFRGEAAGVVRCVSYVKADGTALVEPTSGTDQVARDQLALTNLRLLLNSSVSSGALYQGYQWELATDEWAAGSSNYTMVLSTPNYYSNTAVVSQFDNGSLSLNSGWTSPSIRVVVPASKIANSGGKVRLTLGAGSTGFSCTHVAIVERSGSTANGTTTPTEIKFSGASGCTISASGVVTSDLTTFAVDETKDYIVIFDTTSSSVSMATSSSEFQSYYKMSTTSWNTQDVSGFTDGGVRGAYILKTFEVEAAQNMTLVSPAVPVSSVPSTMDAYFLWKNDSTAVLGTDITVELSRDNGTTNATATLTTLAAYDSTYSIIKARADVSIQPSGTSMMARVKTINNKAQRIAAPALYKE